MLYRGSIGIMEKKMENTKMGYVGSILGLYSGLNRDDGKEHGSYYIL